MFIAEELARYDIVCLQEVGVIVQATSSRKVPVFGKYSYVQEYVACRGLFAKPQVTSSKSVRVVGCMVGNW